jgi:hypothetical protein
MVFGHARPHPTSMVALIADTDVVDVPETATPPPSSHDFTVGDQEQVREKMPPVEYGLERDPPSLPDRPNVEGDAWREAVQLGHLQGEARAEILDMLAKHQSMWSGRLRQVQSTNHRINLIPGQKPVHCQQYRA